MRQTATLLAWLCLEPAAAWCGVLVDLECNDLRWDCRELSSYTMLALGVYAAVLVAVGWLASVTRGAAAIGIMWLVVLLLVVLGAYGLAPEDGSVAGLRMASPIWYRGARAVLLMCPLMLVYAIRGRMRRSQPRCL